MSLDLKDKAGKTLAQGVMEVGPLGESDATRSQNAFLGHEYVEGVSAVEILKVTELHAGHQNDLPLSIFDPQYYQPLSVSVALN